MKRFWRYLLSSKILADQLAMSLAMMLRPPSKKLGNRSHSAKEEQNPGDEALAQVRQSVTR